MNNIKLVNNVEHKNTRVITRRAKELGDGVMLVTTFPLEFRYAQTYYPILFQKKTGSDQFNAITLFGFEQGENLFLDEKGWSASYIPLMMRRQPFLIGLQSGALGSDDEPTRVMQINMDSQRVSEVEGERLFLAQGGTSEYLDHMASMLETIHLWSEQAKQFDQVLMEYNLLEPVTFDITLTNGSQGQLLGFYTINEDILAKLDAEALGRLNSLGYLLPIYMAVASISNITKMLLVKSQRAAG